MALGHRASKGNPVAGSGTIRTAARANCSGYFLGALSASTLRAIPIRSASVSPLDAPSWTQLKMSRTVADRSPGISERDVRLGLLPTRISNEIRCNHLHRFQLRSRRTLDGSAGCQAKRHVPVA